MSRRLSLVFLLATASFQAIGQKNANNSLSDLPLSERIYFGGGGGFNSGVDPSSGSRYSYISVSPLMGYRVTRPLSVGVGVSYLTIRYTDIGISYNQYGINPFTQYRFGKLFAYGEVSMINAPTRSGPRANYMRIPIGLGFSQPIGSKAALNAMALYDVKYNRADGVFPSPWIIRVFITAGGISF